MRLASWNILHGMDLRAGVVDPGRLAESVATLDADVLGLQEVDRGQPRSAGTDLAALAAEALGAVDFRFEPALVGTPGGTWRAARSGEHGPSDQPAYGVALLSRFPVTAWHVLRLRPAPLPAPVILPGTRIPVLMRDEPRVSIAAELRTPAGPLTVATTHLSFAPGWNAWQLRTLTRFLQSLPGPRILLGDLNVPGTSAGLITGWRPLLRAATYPAHAPRVQLDHVLARGAVPPLLLTRSVPLVVSDHCAAVVDLVS